MSNDLAEDINLENIVFFDVCLTCDDEKLTKVSNDIWDKYLATEFKVSGRGNKPTAPYSEQFKTLFINLLLNFHGKPEKLIAIPMGKSVYAKSRYNSLHLTERFPDIVHKAEKVGLIERKVGIYTPNAKKVTRIWPTPLLEAELEKCEIDTSKVLRIEQTSNKRREVIILNRKDETSDKSVPVDYEDTEESNKLRKDVRFYNDVLARHHIDVGTLSDKEYLTKGVAKTSVIRIFNRANLEFKYGGRLYRAFWESINSEHRKNILINGNETIELDYSSLHPNIAYGELELTPPAGDLYDIGDIDSSMDPKIQRAWIKHMTLVCLNTKNRTGALRAFDKKLKNSPGLPAKTVWEALDKSKKTELRKVLQDGIFTKHEDIKDYFCSDAGIKLMCIDSYITMEVLTHFAKINVPVLSVHDSYIIDFQRAGMLDEKLHEVFEKRFGFKAKIPREDFGADEALKRFKEFPELDNLDRSDEINPAFYLPQLPEADRHDDYKKRLKSFRFNA